LIGEATKPAKTHDAVESAFSRRAFSGIRGAAHDDAFGFRTQRRAQAFYAELFIDMHNRVKEALVILGRIPCAALRPPLVKLFDAETGRIRKALDDAKAAPEGALPHAA